MTVQVIGGKITFTSEHDIAYYEFYNRMNNLNDDRINGVTVELYDASNNVVYSKVISGYKTQETAPFKDRPMTNIKTLKNNTNEGFWDLVTELKQGDPVNNPGQELEKQAHLQFYYH